MESWIKVNKNSGAGNDTVSVTLEPNESNDDRTGTIDVATSTLNKILSITQEGIKMDSLVLMAQVSDWNTPTAAQIYHKGKHVEVSEALDVINKGWDNSTAVLVQCVVTGTGNIAVIKPMIVNIDLWRQLGSSMYNSITPLYTTSSDTPYKLFVTIQDSGVTFSINRTM